MLTSAGGDVIAASSKNIIRSYASTVFSMGLSLTHPLFSTTLPSLAVKEQDFVKLEQSPPQRLELISASCVTLLAEWMQFGSYISDEDRCAVDWHFWASKAWQALSQVLKNVSGVLFVCTGSTFGPWVFDYIFTAFLFYTCRRLFVAWVWKTVFQTRTFQSQHQC